MPRKPRFYVPGLPVHVVQRGLNRDAVFFDDDDYHAYLNWLKEGAERYDCAVHAYVLMTNHVHILMTPTQTESVGRTMQHIGRRFVPYMHYNYGTSGTLWEGRYKASSVATDEYLLTCMRYIELNPVRAGMVNSPSRYPWSSYSTNGQGRQNSLITPHETYLDLGADDKAIRKAYRELFKYDLNSEQLDEIKAAWQTGTPLGNERFKQHIERKLKLKVGHAKRGRPLKVMQRAEA